MTDRVVEIILVACGGAIGSVSRYGMDFVGWFSHGIYHTVAVNLIGSLLIGVITGILQGYDASAAWSRFLITGLLGGFTTFSAFALHPVSLVRNGLWIQAAWYVAITVVGGLLACALGLWSTDKLIKSTM